VQCIILGVDYLIQVSKERFMEEYNKPEHINERNWNRAYHFMTEVERVDRAYKALQNNDIEAFLVEITESGLSSELKLKNIVSEGHETNNLLEALHLGRASIKKGAIRVHGGGFGGTCLIFIDKDEEEAFKQLMSVKFPLDQFVEVEPSNNPLARFSPEEVGL
jgi:galactokinase